MKNSSLYQKAKTESDKISTAFNFYPNFPQAGHGKKQKFKKRIKIFIPLLSFNNLSNHQSSLQFAFSKAQRFKDPRSVHNDIIEINIPDNKSSKASSFGKGNRISCERYSSFSNPQTPSPTKYSRHQHYSQKKIRGSVFSKSSRQETWRYIPHRKDKYSYHFCLNNPGNIYEVRQKLGNKRITIKKRLKMYTEIVSKSQHHVPGPKYHTSSYIKSQKGPVIKNMIKQEETPTKIISGAVDYHYHKLGHKKTKIKSSLSFH